MELISFDEMLDKHIGVIGSPARNKYERNIRSYVVQYNFNKIYNNNLRRLQCKKGKQFKS